MAFVPVGSVQRDARLVEDLDADSLAVVELVTGLITDYSDWRPLTESIPLVGRASPRVSFSIRLLADHCLEAELTV